MKRILKNALLNGIAILLIAWVFGGFSYQNDPTTLLLAAVALSCANAFLKPFLKVLLLPINIITLGLTGWLVNVLILYIVTLIIPGFQIVSFSVTIFGYQLVFSSLFAYIGVSFLLSIINSIIDWLLSS